MGGLDRGAVAAAHDAWVFEPAGSEVVETAEYRLARFPDRFGFTPQVQWIRSARPVEVVLAEALARVAEFGRPEATVTVRPSAPAGLVEALLARGALRDNTGDVLALALPAGLEAPEIAGLELRWATEPEVGRDVGAIGIAVFGGHPASEEVVAQRAAATRESVDAGAGGSMVAYLDGAAAGFATVEIVGGVARLAGGGVLEPHRGRGVYRALSPRAWPTPASRGRRWRSPRAMSPPARRSCSAWASSCSARSTSTGSRCDDRRGGAARISGATSSAGLSCRRRRTPRGSRRTGWIGRCCLSGRSGRSR